MSSFPLGVIGIADSAQDATFSIVAQFKATLVSLFPPDSPFPFASKCFAFEEGEGNVNLDLGPSIPELVTIPSLMKNKQVYVGTLLAELCHDILAEFPALVSLTLVLSINTDQWAKKGQVRTVESTEGMEAIMSRLLPTVSSTTFPSASNRFVINPTNEYGGVNGHATPGILTRSSTFPDLSTNGLSRGRTGLGSHSGTSTPQRFGITNAKKRASSIGPSNGRLSKTIGDLCLLAGKLGEANIW
jgi:trafficking protein particle complex subunit 9